MALSKKHYKAIATILHNQYQDARITKRVDTATTIAITTYALARYFEQDNERFDCDKFLKACGISN